MEARVVIGFVLAFCSAQACYGNILFSTLPRNLVVSASPQQGQVLKAGEDRITVEWSLNENLDTSTGDNLYNNVKVKLCYAPISQRDRGWRKTVDNLKKDKTCQFTIADRLYNASRASESIEWTVGRDVPTATFFVRAYAHNSGGEEVAFGQTTDQGKITNLFEVQGVSGRDTSIVIASVCFSAFSGVSLLVFYLAEKGKNKRLPGN